MEIFDLVPCGSWCMHGATIQYDHMELSAPNETLYIRNLEEGIKLPILKKGLEAVFSTYGPILDLVAHKNIRMRGQAFVVFEDAKTAERALTEVQGFSLFEKPMEIGFAKTKSDVIVQTRQPETYDDFKTQRIARKEERRAQEDGRKAQAKQVSAGATGLKRPAASQPAKRPLKKAGGGKAQPQIPDEYLPPNKVLLVQGLPDDSTKDNIQLIFGRFPGLVEIRMVPGRKGIAFVEYEKEGAAITAKEGTGGLLLQDKPLRITYARK